MENLLLKISRLEGMTILYMWIVAFTGGMFVGGMLMAIWLYNCCIK